MVTSIVPDDVFLKRILEILRADPTLGPMISEWRFGDLGDEATAKGKDGSSASKEQTASSYPLCYTTTAPNPEVSRTVIGSEGNPDIMVPQMREYEFWAVFVTTGGTPAEAQESLYKITAIAQAVLEQNLRLKTPAGDDPLCMTCIIHPQRRIERFRGTLLESMTLRVRPTGIVAYSGEKPPIAENIYPG